uniref:Uncharacterized protein n=1 Tax=uncultured marine virus TaxID=186617 RepID=A0A0F7L6H5_9VIRU|nr:hypothetical protein [uncultured marine virus]
MNKKELLKPKMMRITDTLKNEVQKSADKHNEGIFDRELRDLVRIGLRYKKGLIKFKD